MVSTLGSTPAAGSEDRCLVAASTTRGKGPWGSPGVRSLLGDTGEGCGAGTCCPCPTHSHRRVPAATGAPHAPSSTAAAALGQPRQVLPHHARFRISTPHHCHVGAPPVVLRVPVSLSHAHHPRAHKFLSTIAECGSVTCGGELPVVSPQCWGISQGDLPGWGVLLKRFPPTQLLELGGPGLTPASLFSQPSKSEEPKSAGFEPKAKAAHPLDSAWSLPELVLPCHQPSTGTFCVISTGLLSPGWLWSCPGTQKPWGQSDTAGGHRASPGGSQPWRGHGGTRR